MANKIFRYDVNLVPLRIENQEQNAFRDALNNIPYLLYEVEELSTGEVIAINKPGGKRNFGRLSRDDFMVFIFDPHEQSLWLISHGEISDDIADKYEHNQQHALLLIEALYYVCCGDEPDERMHDDERKPSGEHVRYKGHQHGDTDGEPSGGKRRYRYDQQN